MGLTESVGAKKEKACWPDFVHTHRMVRNSLLDDQIKVVCLAGIA